MKNSDKQIVRSYLHDNKLLLQQFSELGFDPHILTFETAIPINRSAMIFSEFNSTDGQENIPPEQKVLFSFTVEYAKSNFNCYISHINVRLIINSLEDYEPTVLSENNYWSRNGPLPKKHRILHELVNSYHKEHDGHIVQTAVQATGYSYQKAVLTYDEELDRMFRLLEFDSLSECIKTAEPLCYDSTGKCFNDNYEIRDDNSSSDDSCYTFRIWRNPQNNQWQLNYIKFCCQIATERKIEQVVVLGKEYRSDVGDIPSRDQINKEMADIIRQERIHEGLFLLERRGKYLPYITYDDYNRVESHRLTLRQEFDRLQFYYEDVSKNGTFHHSYDSYEMMYFLYKQGDLVFNNVDGFLVYFTINDTDSASPFIEKMICTLFNENEQF